MTDQQIDIVDRQFISPICILWFNGKHFIWNLKNLKLKSTEKNLRCEKGFFKNLTILLLTGNSSLQFAFLCAPFIFFFLLELIEKSCKIFWLFESMIGKWEKEREGSQSFHGYDPSILHRGPFSRALLPPKPKISLTRTLNKILDNLKFSLIFGLSRNYNVCLSSKWISWGDIGVSHLVQRHHLFTYFTT